MRLTLEEAVAMMRVRLEEDLERTLHLIDRVPDDVEAWEDLLTQARRRDRMDLVAARVANALPLLLRDIATARRAEGIIRQLAPIAVDRGDAADLLGVDEVLVLSQLDPELAAAVDPGDAMLGRLRELLALRPVPIDEVLGAFRSLRHFTFDDPIEDMIDTYTLEEAARDICQRGQFKALNDIVEAANNVDESTGQELADAVLELPWTFASEIPNTDDPKNNLAHFLYLGSNFTTAEAVYRVPGLPRIMIEILEDRVHRFNRRRAAEPYFIFSVLANNTREARRCADLRGDYEGFFEYCDGSDAHIEGFGPMRETLILNPKVGALFVKPRYAPTKSGKGFVPVITYEVFTDPDSDDEILTFSVSAAANKSPFRPTLSVTEKAADPILLRHIQEHIGARAKSWSALDISKDIIKPLIKTLQTYEP